MHLTSAWCALHTPVCVVHVCHTSFLLWMWYVQVCLQAEGHQHSIPVTLVSLECLWGTLKLCHTPNSLCSTDMCCRSLGCDAVSPSAAYLAHMGCTKCGSKRHTVFPGLSPSQNCPSGKDLRHPPHQYLVY